MRNDEMIVSENQVVSTPTPKAEKRRASEAFSPFNLTITPRSLLCPPKRSILKPLRTPVVYDGHLVDSCWNREFDDDFHQEGPSMGGESSSSRVEMQSEAAGGQPETGSFLENGGFNVTEAFNKLNENLFGKERERNQGESCWNRELSVIHGHDFSFGGLNKTTENPAFTSFSLLGERSPAASSSKITFNSPFEDLDVEERAQMETTDESQNQSELLERIIKLKSTMDDAKSERNARNTSADQLDADITDATNPESQETPGKSVHYAYQFYSPIAKARKAVEACDLNGSTVGRLSEQLNEISFVHHELALLSQPETSINHADCEHQIKSLADELSNLKALNTEISENYEKHLHSYQTENDQLRQSVSDLQSALDCAGALDKSNQTIIGELQKKLQDAFTFKQPAPPAPGIVATIERQKRKISELELELDSIDEEKESLVRELIEAKREALSVKCEFGVMTRQEARAALGDVSYRPPVCRFTAEQKAQIEGWLQPESTALSQTMLALMSDMSSSSNTTSRQQ